MKPQMNVLERSVYLLNDVIVRLTKIMNRAAKFGYTFKKKNTLKHKDGKKFH
jgi:hypothetical protein